MKRWVHAFRAFFHALKEKNSPSEKQSIDISHLRLLSSLQQEGRLIDFLNEDLSAFDDAQVGCAVRQIQKESKNSLDKMLSFKPVLEEREGTEIVVPATYSPKEIKVVGKVKGTPPYKGILRHKGWKAEKASALSSFSCTEDAAIIQPAEVEVNG